MFTKSGMEGLPMDKGMSSSFTYLSILVYPVGILANMISIMIVALPSHYTVWVASPEAEFLRGKMSSCNWDVDEMKTKADKIAGSDLFTTTVLGAGSLL